MQQKSMAVRLMRRYKTYKELFESAEVFATFDACEVCLNTVCIYFTDDSRIKFDTFLRTFEVMETTEAKAEHRKQE